MPYDFEVKIQRPVLLVIKDSDGEIVASQNVATFETLDDMANWFAAHKQQDAGATFKFVIGGATK
jgi:hypothetical protein